MRWKIQQKTGQKSRDNWASRSIICNKNVEDMYDSYTKKNVFENKELNDACLVNQKKKKQITKTKLNYGWNIKAENRRYRGKRKIID